ncbi:MAG: hypothetical protein ACOYXA_07165 [Bacteroidota bacterium]
MKTNISHTSVKLVIVVIFLLLSLLSQAQSLQQILDKDPEFLNTKTDYLGLTVSFGARSSSITSNFEQINNLTMLQEGGSVGAVWGMGSFEVKATAGYYYPAAKMGHSINLIEAGLNTQVQPLQLITKKQTRVNPYVTVGVNRSEYKMHGFYAGHDQAAINYSVSSAPYLGSVKTYQATAGAGISVSLKDDFDFVKLFADAQYSHPFSTGSTADFVNTRTSAQWNFNLGIKFGMNHFAGITN